MYKNILCPLVFCLVFVQGAYVSTREPYSVELIKATSANLCVVVKHGPTQQHRLLVRENQVLVYKKDAERVEGGPSSGKELVTFIGFSKSDVWEKVKETCTSLEEEKQEYTFTRDPEAIPIRRSGDPSNRIDVVFMGDGYTAQQRDLFVSDMTRMTDDMFGGVTFGSYLPLFNIWAVYVPSNQQGIGQYNRPIDTAFQLYRRSLSGGALEYRAVYTNNAAGARTACQATGPNACDFPSIIGNDPYYGGLGGQFVISTKSETSGSIVLRHEIGHNMANVGDEYDGNGSHRGANYSPANQISNIKWSHWLTDHSSNPQQLQPEHSRRAIQDYSWYDLSRGPYVRNFTAQGLGAGYSRFLLRISASGVETQDSFQISLDGSVVPWQTPNTLDRVYHDFFYDEPLSPGTHTLRFTALRPPVVPGSIRMICNIDLHEYGPEPDFHREDEYIGAYSTFNTAGRVHYRPGNEKCLMRNVVQEEFCSVCQESMWLEFLQRMSLIDDVQIVPNSDNTVSVTLEVVPLGQFRDEPVPGEIYEVRWFLNGAEALQLRDQFEWTRTTTAVRGNWTAVLTFATPEVRSDPNNLLTSQVAFVV